MHSTITIIYSTNTQKTNQNFEWTHQYMLFHYYVMCILYCTDKNMSLEYWHNFVHNVKLLVYIHLYLFKMNLKLYSVKNFIAELKYFQRYVLGDNQYSRRCNGAREIKTLFFIVWRLAFPRPNNLKWVLFISPQKEWWRFKIFETFFGCSKKTLILGHFYTITNLDLVEACLLFS